MKVGNRWNVGWLRGAIALKNRPSPFVDPRVSTGFGCRTDLLIRPGIRRISNPSWDYTARGKKWAMFVVPALAGIRAKNRLKAGLQTAHLNRERYRRISNPSYIIILIPAALAQAFARRVAGSRRPAQEGLGRFQPAGMRCAGFARDQCPSAVRTNYALT